MQIGKFITSKLNGNPCGMHRSVTTCTQCMLVSILLLVLQTYKHRTFHSLQQWTGGRAPCCTRYTLDLSKTVMETAWGIWKVSLYLTLGKKTLSRFRLRKHDRSKTVHREIHCLNWVQQVKYETKWRSFLIALILNKSSKRSCTAGWISYVKETGMYCR
jgi:hypothetical protein